MSNITFAHPYYLWSILLVIPLIVWYIWKNSKILPSLRVSNTNSFVHGSRSLRVYLRHTPFILRMCIIIVFIIILARPQSENNWKDETTEGIDIALTIDISSSMLAEDLKPNRIEAAKNVAMEFISGRPNDRIGLVVFSGESFTQCPITTDHAVLINLFKDVKTGMLEDGTAIGNGLATAVTRLKDSKAKSKVIILLTDGENNKGSVSPKTAAEIAQAFGIRIYTIGAGTIGMAPMPYKTNFGTTVYQDTEVKIDEELLKEIAMLTGGEYFRATNNKTLKAIYEKIDKLEKTKIDVKKYSQKQEEYWFWALLAGILFLLEIIARFLIFKTIP